MSSNKGKQLILVGGIMRSGTTLLQKVLNCHPKIYGGPEFYRLIDLMNLRRLFFDFIDNGRIQSYFNRNGFDDKLCAFIEDLLLPSAKKN